MLMNGLEIHGDEVTAAWREAFRKLGELNMEDDMFDQNFAMTAESQVRRVVNEGIHDEALPQAKLDEPISRQEVRSAIKQLKNNKACGVDNILNELLKYGGVKVEEAVWRNYPS